MFGQVAVYVLVLSRFRGRGLGEGLLLQKLQADRFDDAFEIPDHLMIPETNYPKSSNFKKSGAITVNVAVVLAAIQFNCKRGFDTQKVHDKRSDASLSAKFEAFELSIAEDCPD